MDFAFYDYTSAHGGRAGRLLVPVQRLARRVFRPMLHRLRDLLQYLHDGQATADRRAAAVEATVAELQAEVRRLHAAGRGLTLEHLAVTRRLAHLEDELLDVTAGPAGRPDPADRPLPIRHAA